MIVKNNKDVREVLNLPTLQDKPNLNNKLNKFKRGYTKDLKLSTLFEIAKTYNLTIKIEKK